MQNADGQAHLAYFDARTQASFVWDGDSNEIEVCLGGYGEPVDHTIPAPDLSLPQWSALGVLGGFAMFCRDHAATLPDYGTR